jgi:hypothetical protein
MAYEKARIKLLDKNTGAVLKEVDPFTSADAVDYDGTNTVKDMIDNFKTSQTTNNTAITDIQNGIIKPINDKDAAQDTEIQNLQNSLNNEIASSIKFKEFTV